MGVINRTIILTEAKASEYLTYDEAGKELKESGQWVRNQVAKGALISYRFKTATILSAKEIDEFKRLREASHRVLKTY